MDSVIAKLDDSVFGMLVEQPPHILITGIKREDVEFINRVRPDFVCLLDDALRKDLSPVIKVIDRPDDLPPISGVREAAVLIADPDMTPEELIGKIRREKPDVVLIELKEHDEGEYDLILKTVKAARSVRTEFID